MVWRGGPAGPSGCSAGFGHGRAPGERCPCLGPGCTQSPWTGGCGHATVLGPGSQTRRPAWSLLSSRGERPGVSVPGGRRHGLVVAPSWRVLAECCPGPGSSHAAAGWGLRARATVRSPSMMRDNAAAVVAKPGRPGGRDSDRGWGDDVCTPTSATPGAPLARWTASPVPPLRRREAGAGPTGSGRPGLFPSRGPGLGNFRFECPVSLFPHLRGCFLFSGIYVEIPAREPRALGRLALAGAVGGSRGRLHLGAMAKNTVVTGPATLEHAPPDGPGGWLRVRLSARAAGGGCGSAPGPAGSRVSGL